MKVMIVDDDCVSGLMLRRALEKLGYEVTVEESGDDAWRAFDKRPVPIVIADWNPPAVDGPALCRRIRGRSGAGYTYVVLLTARGTREDRLEGLRAGADEYMVKPLDTAELEARLDVARGILAMQEDLQVHSAELERLHSELALQNSNLADAMKYLTHANRRFTELFEGLPTACYSWDESGQVHEWNRAAVDMFGYEPQEVLTRFLWEVFPETDAIKQQLNIQRRRELVDRIFAGEAIIGMEMEERNKKGQVLHVLCNILPIRMHDGRITGAISAHIDITERRRLEKQVQQQLRIATRLNTKLEKQSRQLAQVNAQLAALVVTDGLTGLKNHRHFREQLEKSFSFAQRHGIPFSVIMLDVDRFKQFNDTFGHPQGDEVLRGVAGCLQQCVRAHDIVARYGGEEFAVLCPATDGQGARELAERLRVAIEGHNWPLREVTASFGVATYNPGVGSASELLDHADKALYRSKSAGRNRVTHHMDAMDASEADEPLPAAG